MSELIRIGGIHAAHEDPVAGALPARGLPTRHRARRWPEPPQREPYPAAQQIIRPLATPIKAERHLVVLYGNLAPAGAVARSRKEGCVSPVRARVFRPARELRMQAILDGTIRAGDVIVVRYEVRARAGMREMLSPRRPSWARGSSDQVALITDGRFSGAATGSSSGTCRPRRRRAGRSRWCATATRSASTRRPVNCIARRTGRTRAGAAEWSPPAPYATRRGPVPKYASWSAAVAGRSHGPRASSVRRGSGERNRMRGYCFDGPRR